VSTARAYDGAPDPTAALWERYRATGDPAARARLLDAHLGLVHHAAHEVLRRGLRAVDADELVSAGTVGLVQALEGFDPGRGQAFSSYAMPRIRGAILDELRALDWRSRGGRSRARALDRAHARLEQQLGRRPRPEEVAAALGIDMETFWRWCDEHATTAPVSLQLVRGGDDDDRGAEDVADPAAIDPADEVAGGQSRDALRRAFRSLPGRDRLVLSLSFDEGLSLREIAQVLHVTESRVSQVRTRAIARLRQAMRLEEDPS